MSKLSDNYVDVEVLIKRETEKAVLLNDGDNDVWLPKSMCSTNGLEVNETGKVTMPRWVAEEKGLV